MPKPDWLVEAERRRELAKRVPSFCSNCAYFGEYVKMTRHKGEEWVEVHECDIHPGCLNTKYSICCDDLSPIHLV